MGQDGIAQIAHDSPVSSTDDDSEFGVVPIIGTKQENAFAFHTTRAWEAVSVPVRPSGMQDWSECRMRPVGHCDTDRLAQAPGYLAVSVRGISGMGSAAMKRVQSVSCCRRQKETLGSFETHTAAEWMRVNPGLGARLSTSFTRRSWGLMVDTSMPTGMPPVEVRATLALVITIDLDLASSADAAEGTSVRNGCMVLSFA